MFGIGGVRLATLSLTPAKIRTGQPTYHKDIGRDQESSPDQRNIAKRVLGEYADEGRVQKPNAVEVAVLHDSRTFCCSFANRPASCEEVLEAAGPVRVLRDAVPESR
ncbi:hypothetical protein BDFB_007895 [Asbolus verrucosus]|uniref:Uncharacterized protein n=1 Tax=Asbolus verrucosus TaxID=1661398 RepID=A0A482VLU0_ASBVE|nr:hypothetical protein BDFB_007895 [Asbolus verrucosus]